MADLLLQPRAAPSALGRDLDPRGALPYARHLTSEIIGLDTQALMMTFQLDGASFETADVRDLNDWHAKLNGAWRNLANDHLAVWHHLVRRQHEGYPEGTFRSDFAVDLDARYRARLGATQMFVNELYVTLVLHPGRDATERAGAWIAKRRRSDADEDEAVKRLQDAGRDLAQYLSRYGVRALGLYERDGGWFSEPLEVLRLILTGRRERVPLIRGHLGSAIYSARVIFGREALEIRDAADARFAGIFGVKEYPAVPKPPHTPLQRKTQHHGIAPAPRADDAAGAHSNGSHSPYSLARRDAAGAWAKDRLLAGEGLRGARLAAAALGAASLRLADRVDVVLFAGWGGKARHRLDARHRAAGP